MTAEFLTYRRPAFTDGTEILEEAAVKWRSSIQIVTPRVTSRTLYSLTFKANLFIKLISTVMPVK